MKTYVVCSTPRSGSTLLCDLLKQSGAGKPAEYAHAAGLPRVVDREWVDGVIAANARNGVFGIKIMWTHMRDLMDRLTGPEFDDLDGIRRVTVAFGNPMHVLISRRDVVAQAVSWSKAQQSDQWSSRAHNLREPIFDRVDIEDRLGQLEDMDRRWRNHLADTPHVEVVYEDLVADMQGQLGRVLEFLGHAGGDKPVRPTFEKQADDSSEYWARLIRAPRKHPV